MGHFVIFSLFLLGFCAVSFAASKDFPWANSFGLPSKNPVLNRPSLGITGGQVASPNQFPYQVALYATFNQGTFFCGGSLVSPSYVLTAAQCIDGAKRVKMFFGAHNVSAEREATRQEQTSPYYWIHPDWDISTVANDLALVELNEPVTLNQYVQVIKIAEGDETYAGKQGTTIGWGRTAEENPRSDVLKFATNGIISNADCKASDPAYEPVVKDTNVCFSGEGLKGICKGDSGGPLVSNGVLVGVTSIYHIPCETGKPSVFTRVSKYAEWIKKTAEIKN